MTNERIDQFDYLRALAATFVVVAHYRNPVLPGGSIGVSIFFALSGYLVGRMVLTAKDNTAKSMALLSARRFVRIYPPYLVSIGLILVLAAALRPEDYVKAVAYLPGLMTFTYHPAEWVNMGLGVLWTLHIEFWFYVSLPALAWLIGRGRSFNITVLIAIALAWIVTAVGYSIGAPWNPVASPIMSIEWFDCLLFGTVVAILEQRRSLLLPKSACGLIQLGGLVVLAAMAKAVPILDSDTSIWLITSRIASLTVALMIAAFLVKPVSFRIPGLGWYGRISYPIYLLHGAVAGYYLIDWPSSGKSFVMFGVVLLLSAAMHYTIEQPAIRLSKRIARAQALAPTALAVLPTTTV